MARLLVVTDNPLWRTPAGVFDRACLNRAFFDDYAAVFDHVRVAARVARADAVDGLSRADGDGIDIVDLVAAQGARWVLAPRWLYCRPLAAAVDWADAICVRLPATSGWHAARLALRRQKPVMFELMGDPLAAGAASLPQRLAGLVRAAQTRWIARHASAGSYVSREHLQRRYPVAPRVPSASISSVRLPEATFRPPRAAPARPGRLRLILVASFLPVKNHATLLRALALALGQGLALDLTLVGDGPLQPQIETHIRTLGLAGVVELKGHLAARAEVEAALDGADLFVMPSWSEGMPRAAIEAMARGLPVIGSAVDGHRELLPPGDLFDPADAAALVGLMRAFLDAACYRRGAAACHAMAQEFIADVLSERRRALYRRLRQIAATRARAGPQVAVAVDREALG